MADNSYSTLFAWVTSSMDISGANSVTQIFPFEVKITEIRVHCSVATATATETMTVARRPTPNSDTGIVTIGTFPVVSTLVVGDEVRVNLLNVAAAEFNAGEEMKITCGNSTGTGTVYFSIHGFHYPTGPSPQQDFSSTTKSIRAASATGTIKRAAFTAS